MGRYGSVKRCASAGIRAREIMSYYFAYRRLLQCSMLDKMLTCEQPFGSDSIARGYHDI
jgi:hypothetical protein